MACFRYLIEYGASDSSGVAAAPLTISITFVEVALVTGSFLFIGQADSTIEAQQHAAQLYTPGTAPNSAFTADIATVFQTWLASNVTTYVDQMTAALGASTAVIAAVNTLELGIFSTVLVPDVTVLNATIDQNVTSLLSINSSNPSQTYAYNVTLQVADMLLSVFVDVLNSTDSRRRLLSSSDLASAAVQNSMLPLPKHMLARPDRLQSCQAKCSLNPLRVLQPASICLSVCFLKASRKEGVWLATGQPSCKTSALNRQMAAQQSAAVMLHL